MDDDMMTQDQHAALDWFSAQMTTQAVATRLGISTQRVDQLRQAGKLPAVVVADRWWYARGDVEALRLERAARDETAVRKAAAARALETRRSNRIHYHLPGPNQRTGSEAE